MSKKANKRVIQKESSISDYNIHIEELRSEIAKGWDGPVSKRSIREIISAKLESGKLLGGAFDWEQKGCK